MAKLLSAISILLVVGHRGRSRPTTVPGSLSDADKTAIVESVLEVELRTQASVRDFRQHQDSLFPTTLNSSNRLDYRNPPLHS